MSFDRAFKSVIGHEGGYVNDPRDPGGETKFGISKRSYPHEDIAGLTLARAKDIYRRDFWNRVRGDELPYVVAVNLFDGAVNSGVGQAVRWLQRAAGVVDDGRFGPKTIRAALDADPATLAARITGHRLDFMADLSAWPTFGRGWALRVAANLIATGEPE